MGTTTSGFNTARFFLWEYVKTKLYRTKINDIADLKDRTEQEIKAIKKETLENVFNGIVKRLKFCIDVNGNTFDQYMQKHLVSNKILNISLLLKKNLFDLVKKWRKYLIFFLVEEFPDTLYVLLFLIQI